MLEKQTVVYGCVARENAIQCAQEVPSIADVTFMQDNPPNRRPTSRKHTARPIARHNTVMLEGTAELLEIDADLGPRRIDEDVQVRVNAAEDSDDVDWSAVTQDSVFRQLMNNQDDDSDQRDACGRVKKFVAGRAVVGKELTC